LLYYQRRSKRPAFEDLSLSKIISARSDGANAEEEMRKVELLGERDQLRERSCLDGPNLAEAYQQPARSECDRTTNWIPAGAAWDAGLGHRVEARGGAPLEMIE
jgi:hypothetical protein